MIPETYVELWREKVQWKNLDYVEHDLILSRAIVELYSDPFIRESIVMRGGTLLNKIFIVPASRYSEDLDFVQRKDGPIGPIIDAIRRKLDPLLGVPGRRITHFGAKIIYRYISCNKIPIKLKLEINRTEKFNIIDLLHKPFTVDSAWFVGESSIATYQLEELMATKLRALYQRRKGRDLFDVAHVFRNNLADKDLTIAIFQRYCEKEGVTISGKDFIINMREKRSNEHFRHDMDLLLPEEIVWNFHEVFEFVQDTIIALLPD
jgi:predicted nucleotidyltransferase component of viral defense system